MQYFDSHAHYDDERFAELAGGADSLLTRLFATDVCGIVNTAASPDSFSRIIAQAARYPHMYTALGIHPSDAQRVTASLEDTLTHLHRVLTDPASKAVALGEIGLDYHYDDTDREVQKRWFAAQMDLAGQLDLPVVIHDRDAHGDVMDMIRAFPHVRGILHSFSGSVEMAKELVTRGYMISFSGTLTFKNARKTVEVARTMPSESVLIETDCPYLAPHPHRGELNHSGMLPYTCLALADCLSMHPEEAAALTVANARRTFRIG